MIRDQSSKNTKVFTKKLLLLLKIINIIVVITCCCYLGHSCIYIFRVPIKQVYFIKQVIIFFLQVEHFINT